MSEIEKFVADQNRKSAKNGLEKYITEDKQNGINQGISQEIPQTAKTYYHQILI